MLSSLAFSFFITLSFTRVAGWAYRAFLVFLRKRRKCKRKFWVIESGKKEARNTLPCVLCWKFQFKEGMCEKIAGKR